MTDKKKKTKKKDDRMYFRVDSSDYQRIKSAADKKGVTLTDYVIGLAVACATVELARGEEKKDG
jgi:uncharacterized protein (DUF1778 family)